MHIEFPRCLHGAGGKTLIVHNEADRDRELANGWSLRPVSDEGWDWETRTPPVQSSADPQAATPKKRGRKPTVN